MLWAVLYFVNRTVYVNRVVSQGVIMPSMGRYYIRFFRNPALYLS